MHDSDEQHAEEHDRDEQRGNHENLLLFHELGKRKELINLPPLDNDSLGRRRPLWEQDSNLVAGGARKPGETIALVLVFRGCSGASLG